MINPVDVENYTPLIDLAELFVAKHKGCIDITCTHCPLFKTPKDINDNGIKCLAIYEKGAYNWAANYIELQKKLKFLEELK